MMPNPTKALKYDQQSFRFVIPGDPTPWARCGYGRGRFYDKQKHLKLAFGIHIKNQLPKEFTPFCSQPIRIDSYYYFKIPKRTAKNTHKQPNNYHYQKPDRDNLNKFVYDALHTIVYTDDCIISAGYSEKRYDHQPRTELNLYLLEEQ